MIDATRGSIRIRAWPKKRPGARHPTNEFWTQWLKAVTYLYRYQPASIQAQMQRDTKGTIWMPRDIFIAAARGRAWLLTDPDGRSYYPMAYVEDVSDSLDAIGQLPGMMLFRGTDLWIPIQPGSPGDSLKYVSDADPPEWESGASAAYAIANVVAGAANFHAIGINNTGYVARQQLAFSVAADVLAFTHFRIFHRGISSQASQTVTLQLTLEASPTSALSAAGNDLVVPNTSNSQDSGWIAMVTPASAFAEYCLAAKGSNATVDLSTWHLEVHFKVQ